MSEDARLCRMARQLPTTDPMRLLRGRSDAAPRRCDDLVMSGQDDEGVE
jgi:hypothetical protein